ncbi:inositol 1,4,5-trisphosphate receptor-interacting protein-like 1 [Neopelma chrysocephalum]|uniref:inositol 1,4,5-trisphosphate receptor-interacting protein-like 1 n=1 Tax=Neopelma chrysocephalum TaxID=114329 RepID=UPI000FCD2359|nr:inositol 1,4,5-trisphosphate receptor-interacting protein-like 1 [Neopelma chrysocephalum]
MDSATVLLLAVLAILPERTQDPQSDAVSARQMTERALFLEQKVTELWEEIEWRRALEDLPLLWILQHWLFWLAAAAVLGWLTWQREEASRRRREQEELSAAAAAGGPFAALSLSPLQDLPFMGRTLKKLVRDLLEVCQVLSQNTFMPELHPATGQQGTIESWHDLGDCIVYQLLLFLRPPPRHSFRLQLPDAMDVLHSIRVLLECSCSRTAGNILCFVHPTYNHQHSPLVSTLCTDSHLEVQKVAGWLQRLVESAWERLPQWHDWQLRLLPSSRSCRLLLTGPCEVRLCAVLLLALQQGRPGTFLVLE